MNDLVSGLVSELNAADSLVRLRAARSLAVISNENAQSALRTALQRRNLAAVAGAAEFYIKDDTRGSEYVLARALESFGSRALAGLLLKSGNQYLRKVARSWVRQRGHILASLESEQDM